MYHEEKTFNLRFHLEAKFPEEYEMLMLGSMIGRLALSRKLSKLYFKRCAICLHGYPMFETEASRPRMKSRLP